MDHINLLVQGPRDISEVIEYLEANGVEIFEPPIDNGRGFVQFKVQDPDENLIEIRLRKADR